MSVFEWRNAPRADFAVIGDPVAHSKSPRMHSAAYHALGLPYQYVAVHVVAGEVSACLNHLRELGYRGANVTVPHKEAALEWSTEPEPFAQSVRAANTIDLATGRAINTDAPGFLDTLIPLALINRKVAILGAGGTSRALVPALINAQYEVTLWNRTTEKARAMAEQTGANLMETLSVKNLGLIVNTTSASLTGKALPIDWSQIAPGAIAYDLAYGKGDTPFTRSAKAVGLHALDGRELLVAQGARAFEWWLGIPAPLEVMREALV